MLFKQLFWKKTRLNIWEASWKGFGQWGQDMGSEKRKAQTLSHKQWLPCGKPDEKSSPERGERQKGSQNQSWMRLWLLAGQAFQPHSCIPSLSPFTLQQCDKLEGKILTSLTVFCAPKTPENPSLLTFYRFHQLLADSIFYDWGPQKRVEGLCLKNIIKIQGSLLKGGKSPGFQCSWTSIFQNFSDAAQVFYF